MRYDVLVTAGNIICIIPHLCRGGSCVGTFEGHGLNLAEAEELSKRIGDIL